MGNVAAKQNQRTAPARYVAKQLPRVPADVEEEFAKAKLTIQGINKMREKVNTTPQPYVETKGTEDSTPLTDMSAPRWYMNTWMELMDNTRQDRQIVSGSLPTSWNRDHNEPYSLVRNRIDDEDLDWLLSEGKKMPLEELLAHTKLEREQLEDVLATVEAPKKQYRNYQGKIHRAIENTNTFMADRQKRVEENRNEELLRQIGYSDEELEDEKQYMTNRSRGVKTLDDLGVSIRRKKRLERFSQQNDMEILLEERRLQAIEAGTYEPTEEELQKPDSPGRVKGAYYKARFSSHKNQVRLDMSNTEKDQETREKIADWLDARKNIEYGKDTFPQDEVMMPVYNKALSQTEEQAKMQLEQNASKSQVMARGQGKKQWADPRQQYDTMLKIMRESNQGRDGVTQQVEKQQQDIDAAGAAIDEKHRQQDEANNNMKNKKKPSSPQSEELEKARLRAQEKFQESDRLGYTPKIEREVMREFSSRKTGGGSYGASTPPPSSQQNDAHDNNNNNDDGLDWDPRKMEAKMKEMKQQQQQQQKSSTTSSKVVDSSSKKSGSGSVPPTSPPASSSAAAAAGESGGVRDLPKQPGSRGFSSRWPSSTTEPPSSTSSSDDKTKPKGPGGAI